MKAIILALATSLAFIEPSAAQICFGFGAKSAECQCNKLGYTRESPQFLSCMDIMMRDGASRRQSFNRSLQQMANPPPPQMMNCTTVRVGNTLQTHCY